MINDAYNANPTSMRAALDALANVDARRRVAVVGLMAELDEPGAAHREIAAHAEALGVELIAVGTDWYGVAPVEPAGRASPRWLRWRRGPRSWSRRAGPWASSASPTL